MLPLSTPFPESKKNIPKYLLKTSLVDIIKNETPAKIINTGPPNIRKASILLAPPRGMHDCRDDLFQVFKDDPRGGGAGRPHDICVTLFLGWMEATIPWGCHPIVI